jgi:xylulose-5-phosphate/fructose-6-phosphate phosphoketolase
MSMSVTEQGPLTGEQLQLLDAYWRAANYLSAGQIYLLGNPLIANPAVLARIPGEELTSLLEG